MYSTFSKFARLTVLILAVVLLLSGLTSVSVFANSNNPSSWAVEQVNAAIAEGLVPQNLQSNYTQAITRAEFSALAVALYEIAKGAITGRATFSDTNDVNVQKAAHIGVVTGVGNNRFDPNGRLTREQAAVMLSRLSDAIGQPFPKQAATFADMAQVSSWAVEAVGRVQAAGIMGGGGDNIFAPQNPYTREQSIVTIMRTFDIVKTPATNLIYTMPESDYQALNRFFDPFCFFIRLKDINSDKQVVNFGVWQYHDGMGEFSIPAVRVEETLNRYFGVERINHDALMGNTPWKIDTPVYNNGFYGSGGGVGWYQQNWCNISELLDNGNGTFDATVNLYEYVGEYVDGNGITRYAGDLENIYGHISSWKLNNGQSIVDGGSYRNR
jgi:hypothetical protein